MSITFSHAVRSQTLTFMDHLAPGDEWRAQRIFGLVRVAPENLLIMMLDICRQLAVSRGQTKWKPTESWRICACEICFVNLLNMLTSLLLFFFGGGICFVCLFRKPLWHSIRAGAFEWSEWHKQMRSGWSDRLAPGLMWLNWCWWNYKVRVCGWRWGRDWALFAWNWNELYQQNIC